FATVSSMTPLLPLEPESLFFGSGSSGSCGPFGFPPQEIQKYTNSLLLQLRVSLRRSAGNSPSFPQWRGCRSTVRFFSPSFTAALPELFHEHLDRPRDLLVVLDQLVDLLHRVHHRGVMLVVEHLSDL